jgi:hypothetical protein
MIIILKWYRIGSGDIVNPVGEFRYSLFVRSEGLIGTGGLVAWKRMYFLLLTYLFQDNPFWKRGLMGMMGSIHQKQGLAAINGDEDDL